MAVLKQCKSKGCPTSPRCEHPWWLDVMHRRRRYRMTVDDFALARGAAKPVTTKQEAERVWEPIFVAEIVDGKDPRRPPAKGASGELTVAEFLVQYRKRHCEAERLNMETLGPKLNVLAGIFGVYPGFPIRLGALPGFVVGDRMWKALWKLVENEQRFPRRGGRVLCVHGAVSFHRARPCGRPVCRPGRHEGSLEPYRQNCDESGLQISPPGPLRRHDLPDRGFLHRF